MLMEDNIWFIYWNNYAIIINDENMKVNQISADSYFINLTLHLRLSAQFKNNGNFKF